MAATRSRKRKENDDDDVSFSDGIEEAAPSVRPARKAKSSTKYTDGDESPSESESISSGDEEDPSATKSAKNGPVKKKKNDKPAAPSFCEQCLKDAELSDLLKCHRCCGKFHPECVDNGKRAKPKSWECPDCIKWQTPVEAILTHRVPSEPIPKRPTEGEFMGWEYYVKWENWPHKDNNWIPPRWLARHHLLKLRHYVKHDPPALPPEDVVQKEWLTIDHIVHLDDEGEETQYLVKWGQLSYEQATWETKNSMANVPEFASKLAEYKRVAKGVSLTNKNEKRVFQPYKEQPDFLKGDNIMFDYQLDGLNWLRYSWSERKNCILADEMGLGKTIQSVSFVASLFSEGFAPALIIVPLATVGNWEREFSMWAPHLYTITYGGTPNNRQILKNYEFFAKYSKNRKEQKLKFHALITTYEMIIADSTVLKQFNWELLIVDEGHRLKNRESRLFQLLKDFKTGHRLLLTGTPLQNTLSELFNLLEFLQLKNFKGLERQEIEQKFENLNKADTIAQLHDMLRPHFLRRVKKEVLPVLPPKAEIFIPLSMTPLQRDFYKAILERNYKLLQAGKNARKASLLNVLSELQKLCNHPYLVPGAEPTNLAAEEEHKRLIDASAKLAFLHRMLPKLKAGGHRVLLFSQSTQLLDVLEDYLTNENIVFDRIDGQVAAQDRQPRIDHFNAPDSPVFCFLLSTRACRLGINLATADTVIIYDSDWNPHNDIQAFSRVHRIGQNKKVMIYRLVMKNTVEEAVVQRARSKLVLEHLVVNKMQDKEELKESEVASILQVGAKEVFSNVADDIHYDDQTIDKLLDRSQVGNQPEAAEQEEGQNIYFGSLSEARVWEKADDKREEAKKNEEFWLSILSHKFEQAKSEAEKEKVIGKRVRKQVKYYNELLAGGSEDESDADGKSKKPDDRQKKDARGDSSDYSENDSSSSEEEASEPEAPAEGPVEASADPAAAKKKPKERKTNTNVPGVAVIKTKRRRRNRTAAVPPDVAADIQTGTATALMGQLDPDMQKALVGLLLERMRAPLPAPQPGAVRHVQEETDLQERQARLQQRRERKALRHKLREERMFAMSRTGSAAIPSAASAHPTQSYPPAPPLPNPAPRSGSLPSLASNPLPPTTGYGAMSAVNTQWNFPAMHPAPPTAPNAFSSPNGFLQPFTGSLPSPAFLGTALPPISSGPSSRPLPPPQSSMMTKIPPNRFLTGGGPVLPAINTLGSQLSNVGMYVPSPALPPMPPITSPPAPRQPLSKPVVVIIDDDDAN